jgi:hypothetical protein
MDQTGLSILHCFFNKVVNCIDCCVFLVENLLSLIKYVLLGIEPVKRQIHNANLFPHTGSASWRSIDNVTNLIRQNKLNILDLLQQYLGCELISHKKSILNFDRSGYEVVFKLRSYTVTQLRFDSSGHIGNYNYLSQRQ